MNDELSSLKVNDRESFIEFLELLREDLTVNHRTWENKDLSSFLGAAARFAEDMQEYYDNTRQKINADEPSWQLFADIFKGATVYGA